MKHLRTKHLQTVSIGIKFDGFDSNHSHIQSYLISETSTGCLLKTTSLVQLDLLHGHPDAMGSSGTSRGDGKGWTLTVDPFDGSKSIKQKCFFCATGCNKSAIKVQRWYKMLYQKVNQRSTVTKLLVNIFTNECFFTIFKEICLLPAVLWSFLPRLLQLEGRAQHGRNRGAHGAGHAVGTHLAGPSLHLAIETNLGDLILIISDRNL